jgi:hypothetical protein
VHGDAGAAGALLEYLRDVLADLRAPGVGADEVNRLRAAAYVSSVALRAIEVCETVTRVEELLSLERKAVK